MRNNSSQWSEMVKHIPHGKGVYSVWSGGDILYIGRSHDLKSRLATHKRRYDFQSNGATHVRAIVTNDYCSLEYRLIQMWQPPLNISIRSPYGHLPTEQRLDYENGAVYLKSPN